MAQELRAPITVHYVARVTNHDAACWLGHRGEGTMLSTLAVRAGELLAVLAITGVVLLTGAAAAGLWLKRKLRPRLHSASWAALAGRGHQATSTHLHPRARWWWSRPSPNRHWVVATLARRRLWRAVTAAEHAVAQARKTGAPTGDLNSLCHRLRQAATDTDRSLAIASRAMPPGTPPAHVSSQAADLVAAARQIHDAAASSAASVSEPKVVSLADDVRQEVVALSAGLASAARSSRPPGLPRESA